MDQIIVPALLGLLLIVLGTQNCRGHINSLHRYHRHRVAEADIPAFGRMVGSGTIICGVGLLLYAACLLLQLMEVIAATLLIACLILGLALSFYAMIKYNKGIF
ncbi:MAG: hypothetical protein IKC76_00795 [Firmicutes bacterium]|nr:hypothetical protein [Bacillota bacterium]